MGSSVRNTLRAGKPATRSIRATWRAIRFLPVSHFPLILPGAHPIASFFILRKLKQLGYSDCNVTVSDKGLVVHAHR
ncbi:MAG: hypothetical protein M0T70_07200 [Geobacteraceae bacterium]|nr:hypothetical protein [Geobacteraceae bacterium]